MKDKHLEVLISKIRLDTFWDIYEAESKRIERNTTRMFIIFGVALLYAALITYLMGL